MVQFSYLLWLYLSCTPTSIINGLAAAEQESRQHNSTINVNTKTTIWLREGLVGIKKNTDLGVIKLIIKAQIQIPVMFRHISASEHLI